VRINHVKQALKAGKLQLGCAFGTIRSVEVARILAAAGFNWTFLDAEHGAFDLETLQDICRASVIAGLCPVLRVADIQYSLVARALDIGAQGVMFPRVESPELLEKAVSWTRFPPLGVRGYGLTATNVEWEKATIPQVIEHFNEHTMVVLQIETARALEMRDELLAVPGIDVVMVGPADLSISLGVPGDFEHPKMVDAMEKIRDTAIKHRVVPGTQTRTLSLAKFWRERGMLFLGTGSDTSFLYERASEVIAALK
jgi:2-dehydro-3-deoxyglucarate aldolase/4-hydroxy-2-oxoheptanedioate aldolase